MSFESASLKNQKKVSKIKRENLTEEDSEKFEKLEEKAKQYYEVYSEYHELWKNIRPYLNLRVDQVDKKNKKIASTAEILQGDPELWEKCISVEKIMRHLRIIDPQLSEADIKIMVSDIKDDLLVQLQELREIHTRLSGENQGEPEFNEEDKKYYAFRLAELSLAKNKLQKMSKKIEETQKMIEFYKKKKDFKNVKKKQDFLHELINKKQEYLKENEDAYWAIKIQEIKAMKETFDKNGKIVETPSVVKVMESMFDSVKKGRPVFLHGELGSGKTELAMHLCRKVLNNEYLERWESGDPDIDLPAHPRPRELVFDSENLSYSDYLKAKRSWRQEFGEWQKERDKIRQTVYFVSGHKELEVETFLGGIKMERVLKMTPEEKVKFLKEKVDDFKNDNSNFSGLEKADKRNQQELVADYKKAMEEFLKSPVEAKNYLGVCYRAMKEGRPMIIDEINAIPHHVLIVLNDLLNKKLGEWIKPMVDDLPSFKVKSGFCVIATGNWNPESDKRYVGRQQLDAAFVSRFDLIHYDYLPNATTGELLADAQTASGEEKHEALSQNELFHMILVQLMDKNGQIIMPKGSETVLYNLACLARVIQDIYSGKKVHESYYYKSANGANIPPQDILRENVLSLRHLLPIIKAWQEDGYQYDLDVYLYRHYIGRSEARPDEKEYLYRLLSSQGGFFGAVDVNNNEVKEIVPGVPWPEASSVEGIENLKNFKEVDNVLYGRDSLSGERTLRANNNELKKYNILDVAKLMYGEPLSENKSYPIFNNETEADQKELDHDQTERFVEIQSQLKELEDLLELMQDVNASDEITHENEKFSIAEVNGKIAALREEEAQLMEN